MSSAIIHLECSKPNCGKKYDHTQLQNLCTCGGPLLARYNLAAAARTMRPGILNEREPTMWRYEEVLPPGPPVTLGEGMTPIVEARRLGPKIGIENLFIKDEGLNPTGSFKARGLAAAARL